MSAQPPNPKTVDSTLIRARDVSKKYCRNLRGSLWYGVRDIADEIFVRRKKNAPAVLRPNEFWALQDVSFDLKRGESLAVVGANGAGKSTLLKLLYGLIRPDTGSITIRGNLGAMIELSAGFDPVLSGRENIYVRAALLGLRKEQVNPLVDLIIDFAGLNDFIDSPVQFYSSGMTARLSYAVTAYLKADVLLVDEVIAVGDIDFQRKCIKHMLEYVAAGNSLVLVSHQAHHIQAVCGRGILLENGRAAFSGTAVETLGLHLEKQNRKSETAAKPSDEAPTGDEQTVVIENVSIEPLDGDAIRAREAVVLTVSYRVLKTIESAFWGFSVWTNDNAVCITGNYDDRPVRLNPGASEFTCVIPKLPLTSNAYLLKTSIIEAHSLQLLAGSGWKTAPTRFDVQSEAGIFSNAQMSLNQLVTFDIEWR